MTRKPSKHSPRLPGRVRLAVLLVGAALAGCSVTGDKPWRVEPALRLEHSGDLNVAQGYLALARQLEGEGREALALEAYRKAAAAAPDDASVHYALGLFMATRGRLDAGVLAMRRAIELDPDQPHVLNNLGYALLSAGRTDEARTHFEKALALAPDYAKARHNLDHARQLIAARDTRPSARVATASPASGPADQTGTAPNAAEATASALSVRTAPSTTALVVEQAASAPHPGVAHLATAVALPAAAATAAAVPAPSAEITRPLAQSKQQTLAGVRIQYVNGNGIEGLAGRLRALMNDRGVGGGRLANLRPFQTAQTVIYYRNGQMAVAEELAGRMPIEVRLEMSADIGDDLELRVVIGHDVRHASACSVLAACGPRGAVQVASRRTATH